MSVLSFENQSVELKDIIPYRQDFDGVHILYGDELSYFKEYLRAISLPIAEDALLQKYFDAWCIQNGTLSRIPKYVDLGNDGLPRLKNMFCCEAHNEVLRGEATVRFEGREALAEELYSDIARLQEMQLPRYIDRQIKDGSMKTQ